MRYRVVLHSYGMEYVEVRVRDVPGLKTFGRVPVFSEDGALEVFWTGSGVEFAGYFSAAWIELESDYETYESWVSVFVNGAWIARFILEKGRRWYCLARGMNASKAQSIRVLKDTQAMGDDPAHSLVMRTVRVETTGAAPAEAVRADEVFVSVPRKKRMIEFVGDSITSGEGTIGAKGEMDWISMWFTCANTWAYMAAERLDADFRFVSQSGWGVYCAWDNDIRHALPLHYAELCGPMLSGRLESGHPCIKSRRASEAGRIRAGAPYDFSKEPANAVVINLGTNDSGSFRNPAWTDPETGTVYKQRLNPDGSLNADDAAKFTHAAERFLALVREKNPDALIVWAYGMLGFEMERYILQAIESRKVGGDGSVSYLRLPAMLSGEEGSRDHPGYPAHQRAADSVAECLTELWK